MPIWNEISYSKIKLVSQELQEIIQRHNADWPFVTARLNSYLPESHIKHNEILFWVNIHRIYAELLYHEKQLSKTKF